MKKLLQSVFLLGLLCFLTLGLVRAVFFPKEINAYENRYAEQIAPFTLHGFADGSFQESVENALPDQVLLSQTFKKAYNLYSSNMLKLLSGPVLNHLPDKYVALGDKLLFGGENIMFWPYSLDDRVAALDAKAADYNAAFTALPDTDFYLYFIEKDTDINFETGERLNAFAYLTGQLNLPAAHTGCFHIESFEQFDNWFFNTDHHWNAAGALEGYRQVLAMLKPGETPLSPVGEVTLSGKLTGSKATGVLSAFSEEMRVFRYNYPPMSVCINGQSAADYGNQAQYLAGAGGKPSYGGFYGGDDGEIIFDTGTQDRGSLLILGESFDNAILKLIASHYDRTYSVDLRYYRPHTGMDFDLKTYLEAHAIDTVLLIGNIDYYVMNEFMLGGADNGVQ